jgi:hypothetical protein
MKDHLKPVFLLQLIAKNHDSELKVVNNKGQFLKESIIPILCDPAIRNNHFNVIYIETNYKGTCGKKLTILHQIRGANDNRLLRKKQNKIRVYKDMWNKEEYIPT